MNLERIEAEVMKLAPDNRAELARKILLSLEEPDETEVLQLWVAEAESRRKDLREGKAKESPAEEVLKRTRDAIYKLANLSVSETRRNPSGS